MKSVQKIKDSWNKDNPVFEKSSRERINSLKNVFPGSKVVIFTCGPSLKNVSQSQIQTLIDKGYIIICIKQAIESMPEKFCHFHVVNFCNEKRYSYNPDCVPIRIYCQASEGKIMRKPGYDIIVSHFPNSLTDNIIVPMMKGDDCMSFDQLLKRSHLKVKWGDTMYELAIPTAIHIGCSEIYIVGWDCKNFKHHFYGTDSRPPRNKMRQNLDKLQVKASSHLPDFLKKRFGIIVRLVGKGDESVFEIPYIGLLQLLK